MEPDTIHDVVFGELGYDPPMEEWYARVAVGHDHLIELTIWWTPKKDGPFPPVLERAREAFLRFVERESQHRLALADDMLRRYRESARRDVELPQADDFAKRLEVTKLAIATDGSVAADYDDPTDLFGDHCIVADITTDGSYDGFSLHG